MNKATATAKAPTAPGRTAQSFRDSIAWQKAMDLAAGVYLATRAFPKEELFGLTSQLRRASVSVASNIAEGQGRLTKGEFAHFLGMARGSLLEVMTQLELGLRLGLGLEADIIKRKRGPWNSPRSSTQSCPIFAAEETSRLAR